MTKHDVKTFKAGNSEAVRLPKEIAFGLGVEIELERQGDVITMRRKRPSIQEMLRKLDALSKPSTVQPRDPFVAPHRKGL